MCTYDDCNEADQQYDSITDWVNHENKSHRQPEDSLLDSSETFSDPHSPGQIPRRNPSNSFRPQSLSVSDVWHETCPICPKTRPSVSHGALHLRKIASFALPRIIEPDEDVTFGEQESNIANIDDRDSITNNSTLEVADEDGMHENETTNHSVLWDSSTGISVATDQEFGQEDSQRFEWGLQQVSGSTGKGIDIEGYVTQLEPNDALSPRGKNSNSSPASENSPEASQNEIESGTKTGRLDPNYQVQPPRHGGNSFRDTIRSGLEPNEAQFRGKENDNSSPASDIPPERIHSDINFHSQDNISFFARITRLGPSYQAQPYRYGEHSFWRPPTIKTEYTMGSSNVFRWHSGNITHIVTNDPIHRSLDQVFDTATVFTQNPDTPHLLVVPFNATERHAFENPGGWRPLTFRHIRIGESNRAYSFISAHGDRQYIAARGSPHWMPQLLPRVYDYQTGSPRIQGGLIGSLPLLLALAAFSAPPHALEGVLTKCLRK